jgi:hypothetical protein
MVYQVLVKIYALSDLLMCACRHQPGPGQEKSEVRNMHGLHQLQIIPVAVVKIAGSITMLVEIRIAFFIGKNIPDRQALAICMVSSLYLVSSSRYPPCECIAKCFFV